jgi:protein-L-isoaspartate(D-aspartate) O-methyltransferase
MLITSNVELVNYLKKEKILKTPAVRDAFSAIDRKDFVPESLQNVAYFDNPLPIGLGQTISQPTTVALMLELLKPEPGDKILDIGSGSGWQSALLAHIVSSNNKKKGGEVVAIERIEDLQKMTILNTEKYGFISKKIIIPMHADATKRLKPKPYFDKIIAAASAQKIPRIWTEQLRVGGRMVIPIKNSVWLYVKKDKNKLTEKEYPGFAFVPLISNM